MSLTHALCLESLQGQVTTATTPETESLCNTVQVRIGRGLPWESRASICIREEEVER